MFVVKANPASAPLPVSCATGRGRRRGVQLQPPPAPRGNPIAGVRLACALRARAKRLGLGDFLNTVMPIGLTLGPSPFSPTTTNRQSSASQPSTKQSGGGETFAQNLWNTFVHPVDTGREIAQLATQTPGNPFSKVLQLTENLLTEQKTPKQYQDIKYQMWQHLKASGASAAQIAAAETQLDAYEQANAPGLVGGVDPGSVPYDKDPHADDALPWWAWGLIGLGAALVIARLIR